MCVPGMQLRHHPAEVSIDDSLYRPFQLDAIR